MLTTFKAKSYLLLAKKTPAHFIQAIKDDPLNADPYRTVTLSVPM